MKNLPINNNSEKLNGYMSLLNLSYSQVVQYLLNKYGLANSDYFSEKSYERFLKREIKSITKGNFSRTNEGLFCHHIDEDKFENLSNIKFIKVNKYPFKYQKKDRLVYCDLFEHLILHALIAKETLGKLGLRGYKFYIKPIIEDWYIDDLEPEKEWMKTCKVKAFLSSKETKIILYNIDQIIKKADKRRQMRVFGYKDLHRRLNLNMNIKEYNNFKVKKQNMKNELKFIHIKLLKRRELIKKEKELVIKNNIFYNQYPLFRKHKIIHSVSRKSILSMLFNLKYKNIVSSKKELNSLKINDLRDELLDELHFLLEQL